MGSGCQAQDDKVTLLQRGTVASNDKKAEWEWNAPLDSKYKGICDGCMIYNSFNPRTKWCDTATEADGSGSNGCQDRKKVGEACGQDYECVSQSCSPELKTCESRCSPTDDWCWYETLDTKFADTCEDCMSYEFFDASAKWCDREATPDGSKNNGCRPKKEAGDSCGVDYECISGFCQEEKCYDYVPHASRSVDSFSCASFFCNSVSKF
ncbi:RPS6KA5 [Symbiodinium necroappetens]|uniref:RPS6KA5 protein n=1 Tax=Symbiodinium necroappetens TaxID=1628268 RepID=A0A812JT50_9DINO|nr:RPS6KA5 [Symbiodinium necroappetens]